ncbi:hypothetical protein [Crossiella cryophila]|uniref:Uncharacterized protein n=1 Tax=Crossiella cryophila TaxID=43355 RepID=A0A7W7CAE4_9PSEU|nr:hypothetical protein [Crossiella cryophila]MBB4676276.1 hypothetical protein [Crossiella cryophila]
MLASLLLVAACGGGQPTEPADAHGGHGAHGASPSPTATGARAGSASLGTQLTSMDQVIDWVRQKTGACTDAKTVSKTELPGYLGELRAKRYEPFIAEWATCAVPEHAKIGLVLFTPDKIKELQRFWLRGLSEGTLGENPDFGFGNGFAVTSAEFGTEKLGLRHLWCKPVHGVQADTFPADAEGCVFAALPGHH